MQVIFVQGVIVSEKVSKSVELYLTYLYNAELKCWSSAEHDK